MIIGGAPINLHKYRKSTPKNYEKIKQTEPKTRCLTARVKRRFVSAVHLQYLMQKSCIEQSRGSECHRISSSIFIFVSQMPHLIFSSPSPFFVYGTTNVDLNRGSKCGCECKCKCGSESVEIKQLGVMIAIYLFIHLFLLWSFLSFYKYSKKNHQYQHQHLVFVLKERVIFSLVSVPQSNLTRRTLNKFKMTEKQIYFCVISCQCLAAYVNNT